MLDGEDCAQEGPDGRTVPGEPIVGAVEEEALPAEVHLQRFDELVRKMEMIVKKTPMQEKRAPRRRSTL